MTIKLKANERCPIPEHKGSRTCCGRGGSVRLVRSQIKHRGPVERIEDPHHPRGYRERCTPAELRRRKHVLLSKGQNCWLCTEPWGEYSEIDLEHKEPKGMGSARRDDHMDNLALAHRRCNLEKGSKRL